MNLKNILIAAALGLTFAIPQAEAALFNFSYTSGVGTLAGTLDGTLQADNNTVFVNSVLDFATFDGVSGPSLPSIVSASDFIGASGILATLSLDGSVMDFCAAITTCSDDGFGFVPAGLVGNPSVLHVSGVSFGNIDEVYNSANWSMSAVPVPATLPLLAIGGAALVARRRKTA
ncbi:PEP-CTERM sorting domain-containing protein [Methylomagnum sp.]